MTDDTFKIHLYVAGEEFFVRIHRDEQEEALYRNAVKKIDGLMKAYRERYLAQNSTELDLNKLLAMTCLHLAKRAVQTETLTDDTPGFDALGRLDRELEDFLSREK